MVLDSRIAIVKEAFGVQTLEDWTKITPSQVLALHDVGPATLDTIRLYLSGRNICLAGDHTPAYWQAHLGQARIAHQMAEGESGDILPFTILVDILEKAPFSFEQITSRGDRHWIVPKKEVRLPENMGDYQVEGIHDVTVERKSPEDLYSTLADRDAFRTQCKDMNFWMRAAFIVIEATWFEICDPDTYYPDWRSKLAPRSVWGTIHSWRIRFPRVHWIAAGNRRLAELSTFEILYQAWRQRQC